MYQIRKHFLLTLLSLLLLHSLSADALDTDSNAKVNIVADSGTYNFKTGVDVYEGHVKVDQGTTHIIADKLITKKNSQHKIQEATAFGNSNSAEYRTIPKVGEPELRARAKIIKFYPIESNVTLEHDVHVTQGENSFQGELIHYNSADQTINVPASVNGRAMLVYDPSK